MLTLRRTRERHHERGRRHEGWLTFYPRDRPDPLAEGFGSVANLEEDCLPGGVSVRRRGHGAEIITYVHEGSVVHGAATARSGVIHAGEFERMTMDPGSRHTTTNASSTDSAHLFRIRLQPTEAELDGGHERRRFSAAQRRGGLCVVASADARQGSLRIRRNAFVYSVLLDPGQHVVHELSPGRVAWIHMVHGEVTLGDVVLTTGDGAGVTGERAVSLTAREDSEILLLDL